ncbi:PPOX class F420-dependent oxidoreductase [Frankia gtarii]|uniref:PPOX class F420-dependent oxidoreductase n=1 Tax=Frankia gtarii TaxID=2950102 RepID=UPI0021C0330D|nr:PPOX class F420-dependent oxidoreductase [Frankia gtarii]
MSTPEPAEFPASYRDLIDNPLTGVLTTIGGGGRPQSTAVWFLPDGPTVKVSMISTRQKLANLRRTPVATLFVFDPTNPGRTLEIRADVELVPDPDKSVLARMTDRYGADFARLSALGSERITAVLHPHRVVVRG